jgi:hypothetical protein
MSAHLEATLLPPTAHDYLERDLSSSRSLEEIGAVSVLGAMVEQRRRYSSMLEELPREDDEDAIATQKREAIDPSCDAFIKIR